MALLGLNIYVCVQEGTASTIIAGTRSNEIQTSVETIEISSPTSGQWREHITGRKEWSITTGFLCLVNSDMAKLLQVGQSFTLQLVGRDGSTTSTLLEGVATLKTCKITATIGNLVQGSFQFEGNGALASS